MRKRWKYLLRKVINDDSGYYSMQHNSHRRNQIFSQGKRCFLTGFLIICELSHGQNLVPNPSFENLTSCPVNSGELYRASPWGMPANTNGASSDLFNACNSTLNGVPLNPCGYQSAHTGVGYAGIYTYGAQDLREYLEIKLSWPMITNSKYYIEMYVSAADKAGIACDGMGIYISSTPCSGGGNWQPLPYLPLISNPAGHVISDTAGWTSVAGIYTALGGEQYITIGNFLDDMSTDTTLYNSNGWGRGYYYIDDVAVTELQLGVVDILKAEELIIYPNPIQDHFYVRGSYRQQLQVDLYDPYGKHLLSRNVTPQTTIDVSNLPNGFYGVFIRSLSGIVKRTLVILR